VVVSAAVNSRVGVASITMAVHIFAICVCSIHAYMYVCMYGCM
jgi:hypothetical protein